MGDGTQQDEDMENLVAAETGIVTAGPFQGVKDAAHSIEHTAQQEPNQAGGADRLPKRIDGNDSHPAHGDIDGGSKGTGAVDPKQAHEQAGNGQSPDDSQQGIAPRAAQRGEADGSIGAGDEKVDGGVIIFPQGDPPGHRGVDAVVKGGGGVQPSHGNSVNEIGDDGHRPAVGRECVQKEQSSAQNTQKNTGAMGDGGPGTKAVVGVPALFTGTGAPAGRGGIFIRVRG